MTKPLWDHRLVLVTGKGGVGKSTVSAAIALAAARHGRRACVAELYGQAKVPALFGLRGGSYTPRALAPGVDAMTLTPLECLDDFGHRKLKLDALVRVMLRNRVMTAFVEAVPGVHDLLQLGKIENLLLEPLPSDPKYDLMVVDAPSTGHGLTLLASARTMREMSRVGPFHELAAIIERLLEDPDRTALAVVTLPEDLPVNETLELVEALGPDQALLETVIVNKVRPRLLPAQPSWEEVRPALLGGDPDLRELARLGDLAATQQRDQDDAVRRLAEELRGALDRPVPLPMLPAIDDHDLAAADVADLAQALDGAFWSRP